MLQPTARECHVKPCWTRQVRSSGNEMSAALEYRKYTQHVVLFLSATHTNLIAFITAKKNCPGVAV